MSNKRYPRISRVLSKRKNTCAKCRCGVIAKYRTEIQFNYFRGDDEFYWASANRFNGKRGGYKLVKEV